MGNMHRLVILGVLALASSLVAQRPAPPPVPAGQASPSPALPKPAATPGPLQTVPYNADGWPVGVDETASPAAPAAETARKARPAGRDGAGGKRGATADPAGRRQAEEAADPAGADAVPQLASGTQLGSPLLDIYQAVQGPAAWKQVGGVVVWWRLTIYGAQGEEIGVREITHTADTAFAERDRLEHADGRIHGRLGALVFAERNGMPMPTSAELAAQELMLFGMQLRMPWSFGDANGFVVVGKDVEDRSGERFRKVVVEQRPPAGLEVLGPELDPKPRDRYELLYEPSSGTPRELVHRFAFSLQTRRVLLEDWREFGGVRLPFRRLYVDESMRPTTELKILRIEPQRVTERDFRLL